MDSTNVRPCAIPSAIARSNGMRSRIGNPAAAQNASTRRIADAVPVDHDPGRDAQLGRDLGGQAQVVQPEGGRLGDQQQVVGPAHGFDHRTRGARRHVEDDHAAVRPSAGIAHCLSWRIAGVAIGSPTFSTPRANGMPRAAVPASSTPMACGSSLIAPSGQTRVQLPQPWHNCEKTRVRLPNTAMAWYWQTSAHLPQAVHFAASTRGIWIATSCAPLENRRQEQVRVGAFDVAVQEGRWRGNRSGPAPPCQAERQAGGDGGLAGAALAAGDGDFHRHVSHSMK